MELTQKLGQKLSDIKENKLQDELKRTEYGKCAYFLTKCLRPFIIYLILIAFYRYLNQKEKQTNRNRKKIAYIRKQIAENIKQQKTKVLFRNK